MNNFEKLNSQKLTKTTIILIVIFYLMYLLVVYEGVYHMSYLNVWRYSAGLFPYTNDIYLHNNIFTKTSIIFSIINFLKIDMNNDQIHFIIHILVSTFSGFFLFKIIKEFTPLKNTYDILILMFAIISIDNNFLIDSNHSSWINNHTGSPSYFGHALIYFFFWALLKHSSIFLAIVSPIMLLISVKTTFFSIGIGMIYSFFFIRPIHKIFWILPALFTIYYLSTLNIVSFDYDTRFELFKNIINRDAEEVAFHLQPYIKILFLIISFPIFYFLLKKNVSKKFKNLAFVILIVSLLYFIFSYYYLLYGGKIWPEPRLVALGPTRALEVYELFFAIIIVLSIFKLDIRLFTKVIIMSCLFYLPYGINGIFVSLFLSSFYLFLSIFFKKYNFLKIKKVFFINSKKFTNLSTACFFVLIFPLVLYSFNLKNFDYYGLKKIQRWETGPLYNQPDRIDSALSLKTCHDFILLDAEIGNVWTNSIAGKSQFINGVGMNIFDPMIVKIVKKRKPIYLEVKKAIINNSKVPDRTIEELYKIGVVLILSDSYNNLFSSSIKRVDLKNKDTLILFLNDNDEKKFVKKCNTKIKI